MSEGERQRDRFARLQERRLAAGAMFAQGARVADVAREFGVLWRTAAKWRTTFLARGLDGLRSRGPAGRKPRLDPEQRARIDAALRLGAAAHGFPGERWTTAHVQALIEQLCGVAYTKGGAWRLLRQLTANREGASDSRP